MDKKCPSCGASAAPYDNRRMKYACGECHYIFSDEHLDDRIESAVDKLQDILAKNELRGVRAELCDVIATLRGDD